MADGALIKEVRIHEEIMPLQGKNRDSSFRIVEKNGTCQYQTMNVPMAHWRHFKDIFTTLVDMKWRWLWLIFVSTFFISWLIFGLLWWLIAYIHGDFEPDHLPERQMETGWKPCTTNIYGFTSAFMFSMENQHTTGFGARMPTEECPQGVILMCVQGIVGVTLQAICLSTIFNKLIRSKRRIKTLIFSSRAVICFHENNLCLMVRIADTRLSSRVIEARVTMQMVIKEKTYNGLWNLHRKEMELNLNNEGKKITFFLAWPETLIHRIDESSPLYSLDASTLSESNLEILLFLEGTIESTDQRLQARTSYISSEILWGFQFEPIIRNDPIKKRYIVDFDRLDKVIPIDMPRCSSQELFQRRENPIHNHI